MGRLFKRRNKELGPWPEHIYCIWFPGDTWKSSLIQFNMETDTWEALDNMEVPENAIGVKPYSDGVFSWQEVTT